MLSKNKIKLLFSVVLIVSLISLSYFVVSHYNDTIKQLSTTQIELQELKDSLSSINEQLDRQQLLYSDLNKKQAENNNLYLKTVSDLKELKRREAAVMANPTAASKDYEFSFDLFQKELECSTGILSSCL